MERERATVFGEFADSYERCRPTYPPEVIDRLTAHRPRRAIDVGCGTGKAARLVAARGVAVTGVEADERMAVLARRAGLDVVVGRFEEWSPTPCGLLYAAQAWHWVDPDRGAAQAAASLRSGGLWAAFWNEDAPGPVLDAILAVAAALAPEMVPLYGLDDPLFAEPYAAAFTRTSAFTSLDSERFPWCDRLTSDEYVGRVATHSAHALLPPERRGAFDAELLRALGGSGVLLDVPYVTFLLAATRR